MRSDRNRCRGFTLVELVVVLVVTGVIAVVAMPRMLGKDVFAARGARDQVLATLRYAQQSAIAMRRNVCVSASTTLLTVTYAGSAGTGQACAAGNPLRSPGNGLPYGDSSNVLAGNASLAATASVVFDAQGKAYSSVGTALATALAISVNGHATAIVIEAETGLVH